jgi:prepilin-type N-terminal cleavage/methylation domain-containing protein
VNRRAQRPAATADTFSAARRHGFTLLELLMVMVIMVLMMTVGVAGFIGARRGAEFRSALSTVRSTLSLARQQAVSKRVRTTVTMESTSNTYWVSTYSATNPAAPLLLHTRRSLPPGVVFDPGSVGGQASPRVITFFPNGRAGGAGKETVVLKELAVGPRQQTATIELYPLTGLTYVP